MSNPKRPHIRWNRLQSQGNPEMNNWYFVIVNRADKIETYLNRICDELENVNFEIITNKEQVKGKKDLKYKLVVLESIKGKIDWSRIYRGKTYERKMREKIEQDQELRPRTKERNGLENYVARLLG